MSQAIKPFLQRFLIATVIATVLFCVPSYASITALDMAQSSSQVFSKISENASPAVVFIKVEQEVNVRQRRYNDPFGQDDFFNDEFFRHFFGDSYQSPRSPRRQSPAPSRKPEKRRRISGQGSGFFISSDGYILTNSHVVAKADVITVTLISGKSYKATLIGKDPQSDVALIKVKGRRFPYLTLGDSDQLNVGEWVLAIGNPFGLSNSITAGIVSAKGRSQVGITNYENFIQTDAAINPGNSGGPLLNLKGDVIGMNTAIFTRSGGYMGIGFSIPINMIKKIKTQLQSKGKVIRGYLGIIIQPLSEALAKSFRVDSGKGILISEVAEDSPAEKYGLKQGDVITKLNGKQVKTVSQFRNTIALTPPKSKVTLEIVRGGAPQVISVKIGTLSKDRSSKPSKAKETANKLGITAKTLTPDEKSSLGLSSGIVITSVKGGSLADYAGIKKGQIILEANQSPITSVKQFKKILRNHQKQNPLLLLIRDGKYSRYVTISFDSFNPKQ